MSEPIDVTAAANKAKRTKVEGNNETERHSLPDLIAADNHAKASDAASQGHFGIRYGRFRHQGTAGS